MSFLSRSCHSAVILCGGKSTRLGDLTLNTPKCLLEVQGCILLEHHIRLFESFGVNNIYLSTGYLEHKIVKFIDEHDFQANITIVRAGDYGTGGSIKAGLDAMGDPSEYFFVSMSDIYCHVDLTLMTEKMLSNESNGVILGAAIMDPSDYGIIEHDSEGRINAFKEKVSIKGKALIDAGYYLFKRNIFDFKTFPEKFSMEYNFFPTAENLSVFEHRGGWIDVGTPQRLALAQEMDF